jgi:hypothetical protein
MVSWLAVAALCSAATDILVTANLKGTRRTIAGFFFETAPAPQVGCA